MSWLASWDTFIKVAESGSMAAAARRLDCTRAQVSKQVGDLEKAFGVRLFERSTRKLRLTPSGEVFLEQARRALAAVGQAEVAVRNSGEAPRGVLRISAAITFGRMFVAPLLPQIVDTYPELACELVLTDQLVDLVEDDIDLALRMTRSPPEDAVARKLVALRRVLCATPAYLARHGEPGSPLDLIGQRCFSYMGPDRSGVWQFVDRQGEEVSVPVASPFRFNNIECVFDAVLADQGVAILPTYLCAPALADGRLRLVLPDYDVVSGFGRYLYACYTPSRVRAPKVEVFLAALEQLFSPLPPWERGSSPFKGEAGRGMG